MDIRQLRYFQAIYDNGSLLAASARVNIATTALSYHLTRLETELATPLFIRKPRGMSPTAAGERLYQHATSILRSIDVAVADIREGGKEISGTVRVGMAYSAVKAIGVQLAKRMMADHPRVQLSLNESLSGATLAFLMRSEVDMALVYNPPTDARLKSSPLLSERMGCVGAPELLGNAEVPITVEEMMSLPIIMMQQGVSSGPILDEVALLKRIESSAVLKMNSVQAISGALRERLGCTIGTKLSVSEAIANGTLTYRPIIEPSLSRTLYLCELADRPQTYVQEVVRALLIELVSNGVTSGRWDATLIGA
ncbi:LysR family transcriptional regulator [Pararhodobacter zhoushanensis]|uniref:LysR substrate-binding domain-containing protein n=1 Tax=Pararhodobacter zhoushanensis TaxID=2479545 RepID=A0ABT3H553_9RHOB|nr:LysR substrate-binding domain-containing protein [Pararhodobacter zhoushanensis]MCW1934943.1 LysR substrate-binding domain-containing protein [Pararhodobacter zhoushanensis]